MKGSLVHDDHKNGILSTDIILKKQYSYRSSQNIVIFLTKKIHS